MKKIKWIASIIVATMLFVLLADVANAMHPRHKHRGGYYNNWAPGPPVQVSFQVFYDQLSPYGYWINDPYYGYVWVPNVGSDFRPYYTNGYWTMTEYGNTWVSYYNWGWAPFHYGRWTYDNWYGWIWVPDNVWGPAWVAWRTGNDYYGWAPLAPGYSVSYNSYYFPNNWWVFCPPRYVYTPTYYNYCAGPTYNTTIINNTTIVNNTVVNNNVTYVSGPGVAEFEKHTNQRLPVYSIKEMDKPAGSKVENDKVTLYRPSIAGESQDKQAAPSKIVSADKPIGKPQDIGSSSGPRFNPNGKQFDNNRPGQAQPNGVQQGGRINNGARGNTDLNRGDVNPVVTPQNQNGRATPQRNDQANPQRNTQPQQRGSDNPQQWRQPQQTEPKRQPELNQGNAPQRSQPKGQQQEQPRQMEPQRGQPQMQPRQEPQQLQPRGQQQEQPRQMEPQRQQPQIQPRQEPQRLEPRGNQQMEPRQMQPRQEPQQMQPRQMEPQRQQPQMQPRPEPQQMQPRGNNGKPGLAPR